MRPIFALAIGAVLTGAVVSTPVNAARSSVQVKKKALNPGALGGGGGNVWVSVDVTRKGGPISYVSVRTSIPGGSGALCPLTHATGKRYQGYCQVPRNSNLGAVRANVVVRVATPEGVEERRIGEIKVGPGNDSLPPPPPAN
jgi:hypothetical protein